MFQSFFPTYMGPVPGASMPALMGMGGGQSSSPADMMVAGLAFWMEASRAAADMVAATAPGMMDARTSREERAPASGSWYREPIGVQDGASGAYGSLAGPFAMLPAFAAAAPFWGMMNPRPAIPPAMPVTFGDPALMSNPWGAMWANALAGLNTAAPQSFPAVGSHLEPAAPDSHPAYQSDGGHAVAHIVHQAARALVIALPLIMMLIGMLAMAAGQQPASLA